MSERPGRLGRCLVALAAWGCSSALFSQHVPAVVPEYITLSERDLQKPVGTEIFSAQEAFRERRGTDPVRALELAEELVAMTRERFGESHANYARALTNLAMVLAEQGQLEAAVEHYTGAIRAHERASRSISANDLINPLHGLAGAYAALGDVERAGPIFRRAQNIIERGIPRFLYARDIGIATPEFIEPTDAARQTPAGAEFASAQAAFHASLRADPERALELAKALVTLTSDAFGESLEHTARALTNLAIVQASNGNFEAAIDNYLAAIRAQERAAGSIVSEHLVNPLIGLAGAYLSVDEGERAIRVLQRAIHVSHVNDGPNNLDQVAIVDAIRRAHYLSGDREAAGDMRDLAHGLFERRRDDDPERSLDALERRAAWFARMRDFDAATRTYQRLESAMTERYGANAPRLIEPLVALADAAVRSRRLADRAVSPELPSVMIAMTIYSEVQETLSEERLREIRERAGVGTAAFNESLRAMARAVQIAREHAEDDPARLARTLVKQGDWLTLLNQTQQSRLPYREAWNLLDQDPSRHGLRDELFAVPVPVAPFTLRPIYVPRALEQADAVRYSEPGYVDIAYDVDSEGRPVNVRVVSAAPAGLMDAHVAQQMRRFRFRPAYQDGEPRVFTGLTHRHTFYYDASRLTQGEREIIAITTY